jgi:hypothetical protein
MRIQLNTFMTLVLLAPAAFAADPATVIAPGTGVYISVPQYVYCTPAQPTAPRGFVSGNYQGSGGTMYLSASEKYLSITVHSVLVDGKHDNCTFSGEVLSNSPNTAFGKGSCDQAWFGQTWSLRIMNTGSPEQPSIAITGDISGMPQAKLDLTFVKIQ